MLLKEILDCDPDSAWRAIRSPAVLQEVSSPVFRLESLGANGFPTIWEPGEHSVTLRGLGFVPLGEQMIRLNVSATQQGDVRILRDTGRPLSGPLAAVDVWDHRMAIAADPAGTGKTLYRDQLIFRAGVATLALWPAFWTYWQWRMLQLKRLAPSWRYDVGIDFPTGADVAAEGEGTRGAASTDTTTRG